MTIAVDSDWHMFLKCWFFITAFIFSVYLGASLDNIDIALSNTEAQVVEKQNE